MGCVLGIEPAEQWVGEWQGEDGTVTMEIKAGGKVSYRGPEGKLDGWMQVYEEVDRNTDMFSVAGCCSCCGIQHVMVQKAPREEAGNWKKQTATKQYYSETRWRCIVNKHHLVKK